MIVVDKVTKRFDHRAVLDGVSMTFERGKVSSIVGASGCGKSTLLRCINGLERFEAGSITAFDHRIEATGGRSAERATRAVLANVRLEVGMVFQAYGLFAHMTALENVMEAPVHVKRIGVGEARKRAEDLLEKVGLTHRRDAFPREMSGGEQQRVAIARALAMDPKALLLDEPTSALDPERKTEVVKVLEQLAKEGTTMIIVTHEPAVVEGIAERVITMKNGRVVAL